MNRRNLLKLAAFSTVSAATLSANASPKENKSHNLDNSVIVDFVFFGASPENKPEENTRIIQDVLNRFSGKEVITTLSFGKKGEYKLSDSLVIPNNTDLFIPAGVTLANAAGVNKPVLISELWKEVKSQRLEKHSGTSNNYNVNKKTDFISIRGLGSINYNRTGAWTKDNLDTMCIIMVSISRLFIGEGILLGNAFKYSALICNIDNFKCNDVNFNNESDGIHLQPPIGSANISNLSGYTGDDMLALTGGDYFYYDVGLRGDFGTILASNIRAENSLCAVKIAGDNGCIFKDISISGISGSYQHSSVRVWTDGTLKCTVANRIIINGINVDVPKQYPLIEVQTMSDDSIINIDNLSVHGVVTDTSKKLQKTLDIKGGKGGNSISLGNVEIELIGDNFVGCEVGGGNNGKIVKINSLRVNMKSCRFVDKHYFSSAVIINNGVADVICLAGNAITHDSTSLIQYRGGEIGSVISDKTFYTKGFIFSEEKKSNGKINLLISGCVSKSARGIAKSMGNVILQKTINNINCEEDIVLIKGKV